MIVTYQMCGLLLLIFFYSKRLKSINKSDPMCTTNNCDKNKIEIKNQIDVNTLTKQVDEMIDKFNKVSDLLDMPKYEKPLDKHNIQKRDVTKEKKVFL